MFDYLVIGKGLIGSAAGRYLSRSGGTVAIVGPDEPDHWPGHQGVFASHYDQGRITRVLDTDRVWALLAQRSIQQYPAIEQASGIRFYVQTGGLQVDQVPQGPDDFIAQTGSVGHELGVDFKTCGFDELKRLCPMLAFPDGFVGILESGGAGYINPRSLIAAQLTLARQQGASIIRETVAAVEPGRELATVETVEGHTYQARKVLIAAGAYTNQLLRRQLDLTLKARTILLAELSPPEVARPARMPALIYQLPSNPAVSSIYMLPPIRYPDGKYYLKIGGGNIPLTLLNSFEALGAWFRSGGSPTEAEALQEVLLSIIPDLRAEAFHWKPCVTTYTPQDRPFIDTIEAGQIFVAAGGCGHAAKSSNEIGRVAAQLVEHEGWTYDLAAEEFKARYLEK